MGGRRLIYTAVQTMDEVLGDLRKATEGNGQWIGSHYFLFVSSGMHATTFVHNLS